MSQLIRIKNNTAIEETWAGQSVQAGAYYDLQTNEVSAWVNDDNVFVAVGNGDIIVNKGADIEDDIIDVTEAWKWMVGDTMPLSDLGNKLAIHSSTMPAKPGKDFYLVWTGAGDDITGSPPVIADGELLQFSLTPGVPVVTIEANFAPEFGEVYIHEGYAKWENGGTGDYMSANIVARASALQPSINLDLVVVDNWVKVATTGAGTGTHGFAANPILLPRTNSSDGDWDYSPDTGLVPNVTGTGAYKISDIERVVHHYINKIPTRGSSYGYTTLTSDESAQLPEGYFIRIEVHNVSDSTWSACVFMEVFREQTANP